MNEHLPAGHAHAARDAQEPRLLHGRHRQAVPHSWNTPSGSWPPSTGSRCTTSRRAGRARGRSCSSRRCPRPPRDPPPKDRTARNTAQWRARQSDRYGDSGLTREEEHDYRMAQTAVALLKEFAKSKQQFFLAVAQSRPHTPLVAPEAVHRHVRPGQDPRSAGPAGEPAWTSPT